MDSPEERYIRFCNESTITLVQLNEGSLLPANQRSGFFFDRDEKIFVVTAGHCIKNSKPYFIETGLTKDNATLLINLTDKFHFWDTSEGLDIAIAEINMESVEKLKAAHPEINKTSMTVFNGDMVGLAGIGEERYGFSHVHGREMVPFEDHFLWVKENVTEINMELVSEDEWTYKFKIDGLHMGHEFYKGCSGAPITEAVRQLCSIVIGGNVLDNTIIGFKLRKFIDSFDFQEMRFEPSKSN